LLLVLVLLLLVLVLEVWTDQSSNAASIVIILHCLVRQLNKLLPLAFPTGVVETIGLSRM
jgi:hypothetical protein